MLLGPHAEGRRSALNIDRRAVTTRKPTGTASKTSLRRSSLEIGDDLVIVDPHQLALSEAVALGGRDVVIEVLAQEPDRGVPHHEVRPPDVLAAVADSACSSSRWGR